MNQTPPTSLTNPPDSCSLISGNVGCTAAGIPETADYPSSKATLLPVINLLPMQDRGLW
jgi:hypothetical protein